MNDYIQSVEEETLSEYPLEIQSTGFDLTSMMAMNMGTDDKDAEKEDDDQVNVVQMITNMFSTMDSNDLKSLKKYLDDHEKKVSKYAKSVEYSYSATPQIFRLDKDRDRIRQVNPDKSFASLGLGSSSSANSMMSSMMSTDVFYEMPREENLYKNQYDVKAGRWPESYDECVVVMTADGSISDFLLYTLGLRDAMELDDMIEQFMKDEDVDTPDNIGTYRYEDILGTTFKLVNASDYYSYDSEYKVWKDKSDNNKYMKKLVKNGEDLKVVGIVQPSEDANGALLRTGIYYPAELTDHVIEKAKNSKIVKAQMKNEDIDAVIIACPTKFHKEITVAAANAGKHIFCEKPMAMNEEECDEMIEAAEKNHVKLQIGFMRRFDESFQEAKKMIEVGEIGEVVSVKSHTRGPSKPKEWMYDISISNGPLGEVCSHDIDTVRWFSGSEISSLYAIGGNYRNKEIAEKYPDFYDNVIMSVEFENGMQGVVEGAQYVQYGYDARVEILGTEGVICLGDVHEKKVLTCTKNHNVKRPTMHSWTYLFKDAYVAEDTAFVRAILDNTEVKATGHDGKMAVRIVRIGNESLKEKKIKKL